MVVPPDRFAFSDIILSDFYFKTNYNEKDNFPAVIPAPDWRCTIRHFKQGETKSQRPRRTAD
jgi:hypothetical protein